MHKIVGLLFILNMSMYFSNAQKTNEAFITGQIIGLNEHKIYLTNRGYGSNAAQDIIVYDSAISSTDGKFSFALKDFDNSSFHSIELDSISVGWIPLLVKNNEHVKIDAVLDKTIRDRKITGSREDSLYALLRKKEKDLILRQNAAADSSEKAYQRGDTALTQYFSNINIIYADSIIAIEVDFIKSHPKDIFSLVYMQHVKVFLSRDTLAELLQLLDTSLKQNELFRYLTIYAKTKDIIEEGKDAPLFDNVINMKGHNVDLNSFKGKYLLIDFWASWCGPCRENIPELKKLYNITSRTKIDFISFSIDDNIKNWKQANKEEKIPWVSLLAKGGIKNITSIKYDLDAIPKYVIINPKGIVLNIVYNSDIDFLKEKIRSLSLLK